MQAIGQRAVALGYRAVSMRLSWPALFCLALAVAISGCSSTAHRTDTAAPRKPGGYYLDDGPGANPPANLDLIPDPEPRLEPIKAATTRPYTVFGRTYVPMSQLAPYKARGRASWYGRRYHGQLTASGETYDMYAMTAAHPILPIPSYARVIDLRTGKSVVVRINDRGPFHSDRLIDLSYAAAYRLDLLGAGSGMVEVESIVPPRADAAVVESPGASTTRAPVRPVAYVQLGAFTSRDNAQDFLRRMQSQIGWLTHDLALHAQDGVYRVHAGPYADQVQAALIASRIEQTSDVKPVLVTR